MLTLTLSACIGAGSNTPITKPAQDQFPTLSGIDLLGEERALPQSFKGRFNLIAIGFEREHQRDINSWIDIADNIAQTSPDFRFYEVPVIYELSALSRMWVNNGMRSGIPDEKARERTITVYTDRERFLKFMDMRSDDIYVLLVDHKGSIIWRHKGSTTPNSINMLKRIIQESS